MEQKSAVTIQTPTQDYINKLDVAINELSKVNESKYKTSGKLEEFGFPTNLKQETSVENLVKMLSAVIAREVFYNQAQEKLAGTIGGISVPVYTHQGNTVEDWTNDVTVRIVIISHKEKLEKLEKLKKQAREFMTKDEQKQIWEKEMESVLGSSLPELPASK